MKFAGTWIAALMLVLTAGCRHEAGHASLPDTSDPDAQFLYGMLDHHMHWDKMIDPCVEKKGIHAELLSLCASMETARTAEVVQMTKMLSGWFRKDPPPVDPFPVWVGTLEGAEFERNFLEVMSKHHSEGVDLSAKCAEQAKHPELKGLCTKMRDEQRVERKRMHELACAWFQACS
jgi:uncharacterized protein (DUF305 family)